jgi:hypothetical protein
MVQLQMTVNMACCACRYFQKLTGTLRRAMAVTMAVSTTANGNLILVSFSVAEGYTDKRGSAQLFVLNGTGSAMRYTYLQDLALLNMPAGEGERIGTAAIAQQHQAVNKVVPVFVVLEQHSARAVVQHSKHCRHMPL